MVQAASDVTNEYLALHLLTCPDFGKINAGGTGIGNVLLSR
jgi:hypothetical protein